MNDKYTKIKNYYAETLIFRKRLFIATSVIIILIGILLFRLLYLQVYSYSRYIKLAEHNQLEMFAIEPNRGLIFDRNGILLAENIPTFTLVAIPEYIQDVPTTINELKKIITLDDKNLKKFNLSLKNKQKYEHLPLKYKLSQSEVELFALNQYRFPGIAIDTNMIRHYPLGITTTNIIGYIGKINQQDIKDIDIGNYTINSLIGKIGIEKFYEKLLRGTTGHQQVEINASGHIVKQLKNFNPMPGNNIYLTIDSKLQQIAQDAFGEDSGSVVAIDPNNGEILALVSNPSYDANAFSYGIDQDDFNELQNALTKPMFNRSLRGIFPIASTIKVFLAIGALDNKVVDANYSIMDPGWFKLPNSEYKFRDWQPHGHGKVNIYKAIITSCDTFFYSLAMKMGINLMSNTLTQFGFGQKTGIDLSEELSGIIANPKWKLATKGKRWQLSDTVLSGIGQGFMSTTPLQLANAVATIATRGIRTQPHLLLKRQEPNGVTILTQVNKPKPINLHDKKNWQIVIDAMQDVVKTPSGTGYLRFGRNLPYTVAGKTGTAQLFRHRFNEENAQFETGNIAKHLRNHSLFIAFAPVDKPRIALAVVAENSTMASAIAKKILDYYLMQDNQQFQR